MCASDAGGALARGKRYIVATQTSVTFGPRCMRSAESVHDNKTARRGMHERICKTVNVVSDLCPLCGKHVGTSLVFDGEGSQLGGVLGFLSVGKTSGTDGQ